MVCELVTWVLIKSFCEERNWENGIKFKTT